MPKRKKDEDVWDGKRFKTASGGQLSMAIEWTTQVLERRQGYRELNFFRSCDVGCGPGNFLGWLKNQNPSEISIGFDSSTDMVRAAKISNPQIRAC